MVIDTSAVVAILFEEEDHLRYGQAIIGDCFSYALASATGHPLLFKGNDFAQTDIRAALA